MAGLGDSSPNHPELSPLLQLGDDVRFGKLRTWKEEKAQEVGGCSGSKESVQATAQTNRTDE
jgi:hypothetical protein